MTLDFGVIPTTFYTHSPSNFPLSHKLLGRQIAVVTVSASHTPPALPRRPILSDAQGKGLLRAKELRTAGYRF